MLAPLIPSPFAAPLMASFMRKRSMMISARNHIQRMISMGYACRADLAMHKLIQAALLGR